MYESVCEWEKVMFLWAILILILLVCMCVCMNVYIDLLLFWYTWVVTDWGCNVIIIICLYGFSLILLCTNHYRIYDTRTLCDFTVTVLIYICEMTCIVLLHSPFYQIFVGYNCTFTLHLIIIIIDSLLFNNNVMYDIPITSATYV